MAFSLQAYTSESNYQSGFVVNMTAGAPYSLQSFEDAGPAEVARLGQSSPDQHGLTDLGFRLQPRLFVATVFFRDGEDLFSGAYGDNRDYLFSWFRPSYLVYLRLTRDDDDVRLLQCHTVSIEIDLVPEHYAANLNRAVITLRAANPLWYSASAKTATFAGTPSWWTGNGAIGTANVMEYQHYPAQGQQWTYTGTITGAWSVAWRSGSVTKPGTPTVLAAFHAGTAELGTVSDTATDVRINLRPNGAWTMGPDFAFNPTAQMPPGTNNYILWHNSTTLRHYRGTSLMAQATQNQDILGTERRWRSDRAGSVATYWPEELPMVAVYDIDLDSTQRGALDAAMTAVASGATETGTVTTVNLGDVDERPLITLRGPIADPVLTNLATGDVIDLTGSSVETDVTLTLDLRNGAKSATASSGAGYLDSMGTPAQLASFALAPAPIATGGTNLIRVTGGSITSDTLVTVTYYDRYVSF